MPWSLIPLLFALQVAFLARYTFFARRDKLITVPETIGLLVGVFSLIGWFGVSWALGQAGFYLREGFLKTYPGLWLPMAPVVVVTTAWLIVPGLRSGLPKMLDAVPRESWAWLQVLRIAAIGTLLKTFSGEFPVYFELFVGVPDLIFGVSAVFVALSCRRGTMSAKRFRLWNLIGAGIIVLPAGIIIQMGLPGAMQIFTAAPTTIETLRFPMVLAPSVVVPTFVLFNLLAAWRGEGGGIRRLRR